MQQELLHQISHQLYLPPNRPSTTAAHQAKSASLSCFIPKSADEHLLRAATQCRLKADVGL
eukprot:5341889-Pleurochrysis_carterae.AAC.1